MQGCAKTATPPALHPPWYFDAICNYERWLLSWGEQEEHCERSLRQYELQIYFKALVLAPTTVPSGERGKCVNNENGVGNAGVCKIRRTARPAYTPDVLTQHVFIGAASPLQRGA